MRKSFPGLKPFYFWTVRPWNQWTCTPNQFKIVQRTPLYGGNKPYEEEELVFCCTEQWMMYCKAKMFHDYESMKAIMASTDPQEIKALGRKVKNFNQKQWDEVKLRIVYEGNKLKFTQNPEWEKGLKQMILDGYFFVEASPYDKVWGIDINTTDANNGREWQGENLLGIALTNVACDLILKDQMIMYQEDVNSSCITVCDELEIYLSKFINTDCFPVKDLIENQFAKLVDNFVEEHFGIGDFRHHH